MGRIRRVPVAPGPEAMDGDAFAARPEEHPGHALADARLDLPPDVALGHRVVVPPVRHVTVQRHLADQPLPPVPRIRRRRRQGRAPGGPGRRAAARSLRRRGRVVEPVDPAADGGVHLPQGEERLPARRRRDAALDGFHRRLRRGPVFRAIFPRGEDCQAVVPGELPEARVGPGILAVRPGDPGPEVVHDPASGRPAEPPRRPPVRHHPVAGLPVRHGLGVDQVRMRRDRDEDLHVGLAGGRAHGQRLAGEVRHAEPPRRVVEARPRRLAAALQTLPGQRAELAAAVRPAALRQDPVAVPGPELALGQPGAAPAGRRPVLPAGRRPVGLDVADVAFGRLRAGPLPERPVVETVRKRPAGQSRRLRPSKRVRYRARARARRGGYVVPRQARSVALAQYVLYVDHVGPLHARASPFDSWIDEAAPEETARSMSAWMPSPATVRKAPSGEAGSLVRCDQILGQMASDFASTSPA